LSNRRRQSETQSGDGQRAAATPRLAEVAPPTHRTEPEAPARDDELPRDIVEIEDRYYILATSSLADELDRVLKHGETFVVFDRYGDMKPVGLGEEGLYHKGTRFLSGMLLRLARERPMLLSSTVREDNAMLEVDTTNPDVSKNGELVVPRGTVHILRTAFLWEDVCHQEITFKNFGLTAVSVPIELRFAADYADIFEVRGTKRVRRGQDLEPRVDHNSVTLGYDGLDGTRRSTRISFQPAPDQLDSMQATYTIRIDPQQEVKLVLAIACEESDEPRRPPAGLGPGAIVRSLADLRQRGAALQTTNDAMNAWLERSNADLAMMTTQTADGDYPYAGIPWFSAVFGRDGIITALECLWNEPQVARGVLSVLAATQAQTSDRKRDAEPGKIVHEMRDSEMAVLGEVPFGRYYGSVDATPLFVMLAAAYYRRTGDLDFVRGIWHNVERALSWMETYGDRDGDGFLEYQRQSTRGLANQGWKDSYDSVFHADGTLAEGAIALCEVQGYAYAARRGAADLARALGHQERGGALDAQADQLRSAFEEAFWMEELGTYAEALDGAKRPCRVLTSNPGHCLYTRIADLERGQRVIETLLSPRGFSGWGVRTVATGEARYNPMSYHDGSVWPHDNAIAAAGMARYGRTDGALRILESMFAASQMIDLRRLPELFCGFERRHGEGPTAYPVACSPQSWASASVLLMLQACLGLEIDAPEGQVRFTQPRLPDPVEELWISDLQVGDAKLDLVLQRRPGDVGISVLNKSGSVQVISIK
jgi:glycogen debranching enzyme